MASRALVDEAVSGVAMRLRNNSSSVMSVVCCNSQTTSPEASRIGVWVALQNRSSMTGSPCGAARGMENRTRAR